MLGGKWSGDYIIVDLADFESGASHVRVHRVNELIQLTDNAFPLAGIVKHVELISPREEFVVGESGSSEEAKVLAPSVGLKLAQPDLRI